MVANARIPMTALVGLGLLVSAGSALAQRTAEEVANACAGAFTLPDGTCDCIGDRSLDALNDAQRDWYVLSVTGQSDAAEAVVGQMSVQEVMDAATFLRTSPVDCVGG